MLAFLLDLSLNGFAVWCCGYVRCAFQVLDLDELDGYFVVGFCYPGLGIAAVSDGILEVFQGALEVF